MDLSELRAFLAVAQAGSIAAAAKLADTPRASLRRRIDELEARAGTPLLLRTRTGATLTKAGEVLARKASAILEQANALLRSLRDIGGQPSGTLRILLPVGLPPAPVASLFQVLRGTLPGLRYEVAYSSAPLREPLDEVDLAVHFGEPGFGERWITRRLLALREWLVASPAYLERRGRPRSVADLAVHDLLCWAAPGRPSDRWPLLDDRTFPVDPIVVSPDIHLVRHLAVAGHGLALVPDGEVPDPTIPEGALETVLSDKVGAVTSLCVSFPALLEDVPRVSKLLEIIAGFTEAM